MQNALGAVDSVLLLGGRSEIGLAVVRRLVADGTHRVVLAVRGGTVDDATRADLRDRGATDVDVVDFDITRPETHEAVISGVFDRLGDVDVVVDAVGVLGSVPEYERDPVTAASSATTNFGGHVSAGLVVAQKLRTQGHGTFVVLSSVAGVRVRRANYVYGAAKAGLDGFAQGLGDALSGSGARVMVVRPGFVRTQMTTGLPDAPFTIGPDEVGEAVADGLRLRQEVVWVPARLRPIFVLLRLLPRSLWRRIPR